MPTRKAPIGGTLLAKVFWWNSQGDSEDDSGEKDLEFTSNIDEANIVTSKVEGNRMHKVMLDIDHEAKLIPSSTPGHYHLYIDVEVNEDDYWDMCEAMAAAGILQEGYVKASRYRGFTALRLPWVKK